MLLYRSVQVRTDHHPVVKHSLFVRHETTTTRSFGIREKAEMHQYSSHKVICGFLYSVETDSERIAFRRVNAPRFTWLVHVTVKPALVSRLHSFDESMQVLTWCKGCPWGGRSQFSACRRHNSVSYTFLMPSGAPRFRGGYRPRLP